MKRFIFVIVLTILCTTNNAQQIQQRIWLLMETRQELTYVDSTRMMFSNNIADFFSSVGVKEVFPVFPFSKNDTLRRIYEIQIPSDNINSLFDRDEIKQIYVQEEPENIQLYMPSDAMWDYYYSDSTSWMWHLQKINANQAWDITKGDTSIKIAIIDTWFDIGHPDLTNQMYCNYDPYDNSCFYSNGNADNHGTTVASFAAAETDGGGFLSSIGFNCKIIPYNVNHGHYLERAHHASLAMNADVLTSSAGGWYCDTNFNEIERMAVREILDNGTVIVMPAGNGLNGMHCFNASTQSDQPWRPLHPYYDNRIIIVSSTDKYDNHFHKPANVDYTHSHYLDVDICAPGYNMMGAASTMDSYGNPVSWPYYGDCSGTSFATPLVAGVCALIKSVNRCLTPEDIQDIIKQTADPIQDENSYPGLLGAGRINAYQAVSLAQNFHNGDDTIVSNVTWSANSYRGGSVVIDSLATLTITGILHCTDSARIIVRPGGKLVVDGGTLTSACDAEMWPGITVLGHPGKRQWAQYQGKVELRNGAVIEHA